MPMLRFGHAAVAKTFIGLDEWVGKTNQSKDPGRVKIAKSVVSKYDPAEWLLSHVTIIASVDTEQADKKDKKSNYLIKPEYSQFINNNGDAWERDLLKACYKTFLGADNYVEHVQIESLSKGKVIDVALREVPFDRDADGKDLTTLYVDLLIATSRKHSDLIGQIESGEYNAVSMGCLIIFSRCSCCGNVAKDETEACQHVKYYKGNYFFDNNGIRRRIGELCGDKDEPGSCKFIDASWVKQPAFTGAVLRNIVKPSDAEVPTGKMLEQIENALNSPSFKKEEHQFLRAASKDVKSLSNAKHALSTLLVNADDVFLKEGSKGLKSYISKNLKDILAQDPAKTDDADPGAGTGDDKADAPVDDKSFPEAPADTGTPDEGTPDAPAAPDVSNTSIDQVKNELKKTLMDKVKQELLTEQEEVKDRPSAPETYQNDNLVQSSYKKLAKEIVKNKSIASNKRLLNGVQILSSLNKWSDLKKHGYNRNDVLGLIHLFDRTENSNPLSKEAVLALSNIKLSSDSDWDSFFTDYIVELGRKASEEEYQKVAKWARILKNFN